MGGESQDHFLADQLAHPGQRQVVLTEVEAIGPTEQGQVGPVVDNEAGAMIIAEAADGQAFLEHPPGRQVLFPVLDDPDADGKHQPDGFGIGTTPRPGRMSDAVEIGGRQPPALRGRAGHGVHCPSRSQWMTASACLAAAMPTMGDQGARFSPTSLTPSPTRNSRRPAIRPRMRLPPP